MRIPYRKPGIFSQTKPDPLLTADKLEDLKDKLERLKKSQPLAAAEVARLAELGDFSENAEYQIAKGRLRGINAGILNLQRQIDSAILIKKSDTKEVRVGHTVTVEVNGKIKTFKILGSMETDPKNSVISYNSPMGLALMGKKISDEFEFSLENKNTKGTVIAILNM